MRLLSVATCTLMARMFPKEFPYAKRSDAGRRTERRLFESLSGLDDDWMVFYGVSWQSKRFGKQGDGETDFILVHPVRGILVLEAKGAETIEISDGKWFHVVSGKRREMTDPFKQAELAKHALRNYLHERVERFGSNVRIGHGVALPNLIVDDDLALNAPREIIIDRKDCADLPRAIARLARHWSPLERFDERQISQIRKAIAPTVTITRRRADVADEVVESLIELTDRQYEILRKISGTTRQAAILGGAGTGKTLLAEQRARELAAAGFDVLFVCYNRPLGERLSRSFDVDPVESSVSDDRTGSVMVGSFHSICMRLAKQADLVPEGERTREWWEDVLPPVLIDAAAKLGLGFDAIIVDEGQDFREEWLDYLRLLLRDPDSGIFYVFADRHQTIYVVSWEPPAGLKEHYLWENCRNTVQIAEKTSRVLGVGETPLGIEGPDPVWVECEDWEETVARLESVLQDLIEEGFDAREIVVLATRRWMVDELSGRRMGSWKLGIEASEDTVMVETIHRFKGLESKVVILLLPQLESEDAVLAYIGMSRAMAVLYVLGSADARAVVNW
ncbi:MAG: nuclease [Acidimicrobiales bacterium]|nr:MAG: nuclease [Acidimicrobiales bacterium]